MEDCITSGGSKPEHFHIFHVYRANFLDLNGRQRTYLAVGCYSENLAAMSVIPPYANLTDIPVKQLPPPHPRNATLVPRYPS